MTLIFHFVMRHLAKCLLTLSVDTNLVIMVSARNILTWSLFVPIAYTYPYIRDASDYEMSESSVAIFNVSCPYEDYCDTYYNVDYINGSGCSNHGGQAIVSCGE